MERNLRLNWQALVEEARRRRKELNLTQQRLAAVADVSVPTVSRFESGEKNIQLASALAILEAIGMTDKSLIVFPEKVERYSGEREIILFEGRADQGIVTCGISAEALMDHFGARNLDRRALLSAFKAHRPAIERAATRKFESGLLEKDGSVLIRSADL